MIGSTRHRYIVQCSWQREASAFYISCLQDLSGKLSIVDAETAKRVLFGWHRASYYGTMLETVQLAHLPCIVVTPLLALDYFASPKPLANTELHWDEACRLAMEAAPHMRAALLESRFKPSAHAWLQGVPGWELLHADEDAAAAYRSLEAKSVELDAFCTLQDWFNGAVLELVLQNDEVKSAWQPLVRKLHSMSAVGMSLEHGFDEENWLVSVGWKHDETPFRIALKLVEPERDDLVEFEARGSRSIVDEAWTLHLMLQDKIDPYTVMEVPADSVPDENEVPSDWRPYIRSAIWKQQQGWASLVPELADADSETRYVKSRLSEEEVWFFLTEGSLRLVEAGVVVLLPSWWEGVRKARPQLKVQVHSTAQAHPDSLFGLDRMVNFDWRVAIGNMELSEAEFRRLAESKRRLFRIHGKWVQLDAQLVERLRRTVAKTEKRGLSLGNALAQYWMDDAANDEADAAEPGSVERSEKETVAIEVELDGQLQQLAGQLQRSAKVPLLPAPEGLQGTLRNYQREGFSWMVFLHRFGMGGCLADDMGLGKTVQWLAYLLYLKQEHRGSGPALLICPTSVIGNWQKEAERFAPSLRVHLHYGPHRAKGKSFAPSIAEADLVITSYTLAHLDIDELSSIAWGSLCLDEAQHIKNAHTKQASSIRRLNARHRIALTGTPVENRLSELWSIFEFLNPHYLGSFRQFQQRFVHPIEKEGNAERIAQVQRMIRPFLLRRMKKDPAIQLDLPDKHETKVFVSLTQEQAALYENVLQHMLEQIDRLPAMERRGLVVATLTKLKQICNHPALLLKENMSFRGTRTVERSYKLTRLLEMIQEVRAEGEKCLVFTQYVQMGYLLEAAIQGVLGQTPQFLHGSVPKRQRDLMIERFQNESADTNSIFILSLRAGGTGLNLTGASHVFHFDRWWNPAVEDQATDRAYRIGQTKDVQVHKFITLGTMEERIDEMLERKQRLSSQIVGSSEQWITELSTGELQQLFALRRQWVRG